MINIHWYEYIFLESFFFLSPYSIIFQQVRIYCTYVWEFGVLEFIVAAAGPACVAGPWRLH